MRKLVSFLGALALLISACNSSDADRPSDSVAEVAGTESTDAEPATPERSYAGEVPAPDFPAGLAWLNIDRPLSLEQLQGKVVLLDFWTYGCINCIHIIPELKQLEAEFGDALTVIGVHSAKFEQESETDNIRQIILRYEIEHPVVNDRDFEVWRTWGANAWPTLVMIDPAGNYVGYHSGEGIYDLFQPVIASLVSEFEASGELDRTPLAIKLESEGLPQTVLSFPGKVLTDAAGGRLFIADTNHDRIVVADLFEGDVLGVIGRGEAGFEDGPIAEASFADPQGMVLSEDGRFLYVADTENHAVRRVDLDAGVVTTAVGTGEKGWPPTPGQAPDHAINSPWDLELDGDRLFIAMAGTHQLWALDLGTGEVGPLVGSAREGVADGSLAGAELAQPSGLAFDGAGHLYFTDPEASSIRLADLPDDAVSTVAGSGLNLFDFGDVDGQGAEARFQHPLGITLVDDILYVADTYNSKIKRVDPASGEVTTLVGSDNGWRDGADPLFYEPGGIDAAGGRLYVADTNNHTIRVVDVATGETSTLVLKGIERFEPKDREYAGRLVRLEPATVGAGPGKILLDVAIPRGYKVNGLAPSRMDWTVSGGVATLAADANRSVVAPEFPQEVLATFSEGTGIVTADLTIYYCEAETENICLIDQARVELPVEVDADGSDTLTADYRIDLPDL